MRYLCKHLASLASRIRSVHWGQGHCHDCAEWFNVHNDDLILRSVISHSSLLTNQDLFLLSRRLKVLHVHAGQSWVGLSLVKSAKTIISWTWSWRHYSKVTQRSLCYIQGHLQPQLASMSTSSPPPKKPKNSELEEFDAVFPTIVDDLIAKGAKDAEIGDAMIRFREVLEYNVPHGKKNRGVSVVTSYKFLVNGDQQTNEDLLRARVLGWCVELLQAYFLVADDIMDQSVTRRGRPCWYKRDDVGTIAINDSFYLECTIYALLKKYFRDQSYYVDIMDLFHETTTQTVIGQALDLTTAPASVDFSKFSMDRYSAIVKWKTAFYSFYLPVALAMYMAGVNDTESHSNAKSILLQMGHFFQVQDDYLDCYGDPVVTGKIGTDIEDNKCGWLINKALEQASPEQRKMLEENYAQHDPAKVKKVKEIFKELKVEEAYHAYEESSYKELMDLIEKYSLNLPKEMFTAFANKIYKRLK